MEREQKIRWAVESAVGDLVDRQAADDGSGDRGWARAIVALREHGARLLEPPPQLFAALELPEEFSQSVVVDVPVPSTAGDFVVSVRATVRDLASYEHWSGSVLRAEPAESDFAELKARTRELVAAARARRAQDARGPFAPRGAGAARRRAMAAGRRARRVPVAVRRRPLPAGRRGVAAPRLRAAAALPRPARPERGSGGRRAPGRRHARLLPRRRPRHVGRRRGRRRRLGCSESPIRSSTTRATPAGPCSFSSTPASRWGSTSATRGGSTS